MKIAYLSGALLPSKSANSVHVMKMCAALAAAGHSVRLYGRAGDAGSADLFAYYGVPSSFELHLTSIGPFMAARQVVEAMGDWAAFAPDLFYARYRPLAAAASLTGLPLIFEAHQMPQRTVDQWCENIILRPSRAASLVTISQVLADDYVAAGFSSHRNLIVAHDGADPQPPRYVRRENRPIRAGFVGSLYPGKGMEMILALADRMPEVEFHVVGGAEDHVRAWRTQSTAPNLHMHGYVPHAEVGDYMASFDLALLPMQKKVSVDFKGSDIGRWTSPLKLFEYMAAGLPIVASDLPTIGEVITDGENGRLVPYGDVSAWKNVIENLADDPDQRHHLAARAFNDLNARYSWLARANQILIKTS